MDILIKGGRVINPATQTDEEMDVRIRGEQIDTWGSGLEPVEGEQVLDAAGCLVMPGLIDMHVHLRDPGLTEKEDIASGSAAAAAGGYTTVLAMPNTKPVADTPEVIRYVHDKAKAAGLVRVFQVGAVTKGMEGKSLSDLEGMFEEGIPAISEDGKSVMDSGLYRDAMRVAAAADIPVLAHCEDIHLVQGGVINLGSKSEELRVPGISNAVENIIAARDIMLAEETGAQLHLCHCSTAESVEMVRMAKARGIRVSGEVCPHHFTLTDEDITEGDANFKMNPPLRSRRDVEALRDGLRDGTMEVIATDHAPHTKEEKQRDLRNAPFGIVGMETAAALTYTELVQTGCLTLMGMAEKMSANPARILGIDGGDIRPGMPADVMIFDPGASYEIHGDDFRGRGKNMPYEGRRVRGRVAVTILRGQISYRFEQK